MDAIPDIHSQQTRLVERLCAPLPLAGSSSDEQPFRGETFLLGTVHVHSPSISCILLCQKQSITSDQLLELACIAYVAGAASSPAAAPAGAASSPVAALGTAAPFPSAAPAGASAAKRRWVILNVVTAEAHELLTTDIEQLVGVVAPLAQRFVRPVASHALPAVSCEL